MTDRETLEKMFLTAKITFYGSQHREGAEVVLHASSLPEHTHNSFPCRADCMGNRIQFIFDSEDALVSVKELV